MIVLTFGFAESIFCMRGYNGALTTKSQRFHLVNFLGPFFLFHIVYLQGIAKLQQLVFRIFSNFARNA